MSAGATKPQTSIITEFAISIEAWPDNSSALKIAVLVRLLSLLSFSYLKFSCPTATPPVAVGSGSMFFSFN